MRCFQAELWALLGVLGVLGRRQDTPTAGCPCDCPPEQVIGSDAAQDLDTQSTKGFSETPPRKTLPQKKPSSADEPSETPPVKVTRESRPANATCEFNMNARGSNYGVTHTMIESQAPNSNLPECSSAPLTQILGPSPRLPS